VSEEKEQGTHRQAIQADSGLIWARGCNVLKALLQSCQPGTAWYNTCSLIASAEREPSGLSRCLRLFSTRRANPPAFLGFQGMPTEPHGKQRGRGSLRGWTHSFHSRKGTSAYHSGIFELLNTVRHGTDDHSKVGTYVVKSTVGVRKLGHTVLLIRHPRVARHEPPTLPQPPQPRHFWAKMRAFGIESSPNVRSIRGYRKNLTPVERASIVTARVTGVSR
jgi:hypothetical protein